MSMTYLTACAREIHSTGYLTVAQEALKETSGKIAVAALGLAAISAFTAKVCTSWAATKTHEVKVIKAAETEKAAEAEEAEETAEAEEAEETEEAGGESTTVRTYPNAEKIALWANRVALFALASSILSAVYAVYSVAAAGVASVSVAFPTANVKKVAATIR